jgi:recombination protein RecA
VRLDVRRIESIKQGDQVVGNRTRVTVKKNKVAPPFRTAEFDIMYNEGISTVGDLLDLGVSYDILTKRGAFYRYNEELIGQGRETSKEYLRQNPAVALEIDARIRERAGLPRRTVASLNGE